MANNQYRITNNQYRSKRDVEPRMDANAHKWEGRKIRQTQLHSDGDAYYDL